MQYYMILEHIRLELLIYYYFHYSLYKSILIKSVIQKKFFLLQLTEGRSRIACRTA